MKKDLIPFTPQGLERPVALVSPNASQLVLDVLNNSWDKSSSGLGSHIYMDSESITDPDELQEYWEAVWSRELRFDFFAIKVGYAYEFFSSNF